MQSKPDAQLLRDYAEHGAETAFTELVARHTNLVYSAAFRQVESPDIAAEIAQNVFVSLARGAKTLAPKLAVGASLAGWLCRSARNLSLNHRRNEFRRQTRERQAMEQLIATPDATPDWEPLRRVLDDALSELPESDYDAVVHRFYLNQDLKTVGAAIGASDDTAQKRVARALEKLRDLLAQRGIRTTAGALGLIIAGNAVQAAPAGLAAAIAAALSGTPIVATALFATTKAIAMITLQKTLIIITLAATVGAGIYEASEVAKARAGLQTLQRQQAPLTELNQQLQRERDDATNRLASLAGELAIANRNNLELLKLRNEISLLRRNQAAIPTPGDATALQTQTAGSNEPTSGDLGRELGLAVVRGDAGALTKLLAESRAEYQNFNRNDVGLNDSQRDDLSRTTFAPIHAAFRVIEDAAVTGNQPALDAVIQAIQIPELKSLASTALGMLAGQGNDQALQILINPEKYGFTLASAVDDLHFAADNGNQKAIDALAAVATNQAHSPLWLLTANGLAQAAAAGNPVAIDSLISMSSSTNQNIQNAVVQALRGAAANQNPKATEALRAMGIQ